MSHKHDPSKALVELWEVLLRYRGRFVVVAFVTSLLVLTLSLWLPRKYRAEATFERRTDMVLTEITNKGATQSFQDPRTSLREEIAGPPAIDQLIDRLEPQLRRKGLLDLHYDKRDLRHDLLRRVIVHWDIASTTLDRVRLEYIGRDPELAQMVVNGLIEQHIQRARDLMQRRLEESASFFRKEVVASRRTIEALENQVLQFEMKHADLLPENPNSLGAKLAEAETNLVELVGLRDAAKMRVDALQEALRNTPEKTPTVVTGPNPRRAELEAELRKLADTEAEYINTLKMKPAHPDLIAVRRQMVEIEQALAELPEEVVTETRLADNPKHAELELRLTQAVGDYQALAEQVESLKKQIAIMSAKSTDMFQVRSDYQRLQRQVNEAHRQLAFWEDNLRRVEMAMTAEQGNRAVQFNFVQPAHANTRPVSPNLAQVLLAAVGLGLMAGSLGVFLAHRTDESCSDPEQLAAGLNVPLLGSVSELITHQQKRMRRLRHAVVYPANALAMLLVLAAMSGVVYLNLERPELFDRLKGRAVAMIGASTGPHRAQAASEDGTPVTDDARVDGPAPRPPMTTDPATE